MMRFPPGAGEPAPAPDPRLKFVMQRDERDQHDAFSGKSKAPAHKKPVVKH